MASNRVTLTEAVFWTKRFGAVLVVGIIIIVLLRFIISILLPGQGEKFKYLTPDNACITKIPDVSISGLTLADGSTSTISLDTPDGRLPDLPDVVNVYRYEHPGQSLNALEDANTLAKEIGFPPESKTKLTDTDFKWIDKKNGRELNVNLDNLNFSIKTSNLSQVKREEDKELPTEEKAKENAIKWLQSLGLATKDLSISAAKVYFLQIDHNEKKLTSSRQNANFVRVDFFRKIDLITINKKEKKAENLGKAIKDKLVAERGTDPDTGKTEDLLRYTTDIVTESLDKSYISITFNGDKLKSTTGETNLWEMDYFNWRLPTKACGTYQLISEGEAFTELKSGKGKLIKIQRKFGGDPFTILSPQLAKQIQILNIDLVYLDTLNKQEYLQPMYRFSGDAILGDSTKADIVYLVSAVKR